MKKLVEGSRITLKDLAEWFGISHVTIRTSKAKQKKLKLLKAYADYHFEGKFIVIDKVYIEEYSKAYDFIKEKLPEVWHKNGLDTCSRVGVVIHDRYKEVSTQIQLTTAKSYTNRAKIELFGRNHIENDRGELGISRYRWGTSTNTGECLPLTAEQDKIMAECAQESYGNILGSRAALLNNALRSGEITEQEFCEGLVLTPEEREKAYWEFESLVLKRLGFMPMRLTEVAYTQTWE